MTRTILLPQDGSTASRAALPYAAALAPALQCSVRLLTAIGGGDDALLRELNGPDYLGVVRTAVATALQVAENELTAAGVIAESVIADGGAAESILKYAEERDVALIVMATHGAGEVARMLVGSVADKVMRLSRRPILLVEPPRSPEAPREVSLHKVLVPLDGSSLAEAALPLATELATAAGASLTLARAVALPLYALSTSYISPMPELVTWEGEMRAAAAEYLTGVRGSLPASLPVETLVLRGAAGMKLTDAVKREKIDLVVMSTHGRGGLGRLLLGSTADELVRKGVPTLLVRPHEPGDVRGYYLVADVPQPWGQTLLLLKNALAARGFQLLADRAIGSVSGRRLLLTLYTPALASGSGLDALDIAVRLPCSIGVMPTPGGTRLIVLDPRALASLAPREGRDEIERLAEESAERLQAILDEITGVTKV